jgi:hypothetical protein
MPDVMERMCGVFICVGKDLTRTRSATAEPRSEGDAPGSGWLHRLVRHLCRILLGEQNTKRLYGDDNAAEQLEAYARERGMTVVSCKDDAWHEAILNWVIDLLAYAEQEEAEEKEERVTLQGAIGTNSQRAYHTSTTENGESVPPVLKLKPGERVTHIACKV